MKNSDKRMMTSKAVQRPQAAAGVTAKNITEHEKNTKRKGELARKMKEKLDGKG